MWSVVGVVGGRCGQWEGGVSEGVATGEAWEVGKCGVCVVLVCSYAVCVRSAPTPTPRVHVGGGLKEET